MLPRRPLVSLLVMIATFAIISLSGIHETSAADPERREPADTAATDAGEDQPPATDSDADEIPGLGNIIGSPDAGPKPEDAGDRGGYAQLLLAAVLFGAVAFILRKIFREAAGTTGV